ncbi:histidine kinase N-terminal 7TM domain-containing protein [Cohnella sp. GCM10012308]|uniref:sensor histidine kinase n=1 Tax=Cohnella sp. GCM10012308 TaxID=3317329 RepID=UPI003620C055
MGYNLTLSAILMIFTFGFMVLLNYSWQNRETPISVSYGLGVLSASFYTFGYAFQLVSTTVDQMLFWIHVQYLGIPFAPFIWVIMILQFTGNQKMITKKSIALLSTGPLCILISHFTNPWHHLFYKDMALDYSQGFPLIILDRGPLFYLHIVYVCSYYLAGIGLLVHMYLKSRRERNRERNKRIVLMMIGSFCIFAPPLIHSIGVVKILIDISPFGLIFSGLFYFWGIHRFNILNLSPLVTKKVFESIHDAVLIFDINNKLRSYNNSADILFNQLPDKKRIGSPASQVLSPFPSLLQFMEHESDQSHAIRRTMQLGDRYYHVQFSNIDGRNNKPVSKILILHDVTESTLYEESLLQQSRQLSELNLFKDKMFNVIAHDIRDPLAVLVNLMELVEEDMQEAELIKHKGNHQDLIKEMGGHINNTFLLVESLLEWFHTQRGGMLFNPVVRDLGNVVQKTINMMKAKINSKQMHINSTIAENVYVYADKDMLDLIIRNLLSNAVKFTEIGGAIRLSSEVLQDKVVVAVRDTGQGISVDEASYLLQDEFPISKRGTAGEQGVGLGLSICREFVRLNGGEIWFDSSLGVGTTFYFSLPIASKRGR